MSKFKKALFHISAMIVGNDDCKWQSLFYFKVPDFRA